MLRLFLAAALLLATARGAHGQVVSYTTFCLGIAGNECTKPVPAGSAISLSGLPHEGQDRVIYFLADIRSTTKVPAAIVFLRQGTCAQEQVKLSAGRFNETVPATDGLRDYLRSANLADLWHWLGFKEASVDVKDVKVEAGFIAPSDHYRFWDYRIVGCAGSLQARVFNPDGHPLAGNNAALAIDIQADTAQAAPPDAGRRLALGASRPNPQ